MSSHGLSRENRRIAFAELSEIDRAQQRAYGVENSAETDSPNIWTCATCDRRGRRRGPRTPSPIAFEATTIAMYLRLAVILACIFQRAFSFSYVKFHEPSAQECWCRCRKPIYANGIKRVAAIRMEENLEPVLMRVLFAKGTNDDTVRALVHKFPIEQWRPDSNPRAELVSDGARLLYQREAEESLVDDGGLCFTVVSLDDGEPALDVSRIIDGVEDGMPKVIREKQASVVGDRGVISVLGIASYYLLLSPLPLVKAGVQEGPRLSRVQRLLRISSHARFWLWVLLKRESALGGKCSVAQCKARANTL